MINYKISLIVPFFNRGLIIDNLINSCLNQVYKNYEVIIVDDGSTNNFFDKNKYNDNRIYFYQKGHTGPGLTRQYGYSKATGDLIYFIDSDDSLPNEHTLEKINLIFNEYNPDVLFFDRADYDGNEIELINSFSNITEGFHSIKDLNERIVPGLGCKIFRKEKLKDDMFIEALQYEDFYTSYRYLDYCNNFYYTKECFYYIFHDDKDNSLSLRKDIETAKILNATIDIVIKVYKETKNEFVKRSITASMANIYIHYFLNRKNVEFNNDEYKKKIYEIVTYTRKYKIKYPFENKNFLKMCAYHFITYHLLFSLRKYKE